MKIDVTLTPEALYLNQYTIYGQSNEE